MQGSRAHIGPLRWAAACCSLPLQGLLWPSWWVMFVGRLAAAG